MLPPDPPPVIVNASIDKPADVVVVSRDTHSDVLVSTDTPLPLMKAHKTEDALLRQTIFLTSTLTVVRPAVGAGGEILRWTYEPYLQRQLCFTSITGQFSCATAEVEELTEKVAGEAPIAETPGQAKLGPNPAAEAARIAIVTALSSRASALFEADRRFKLTPMLTAAGVSIRRPPNSAGSVRR